MKPQHMSRALWRSFRREFNRSPFGALTILLRKARISQRVDAMVNDGSKLRYAQYAVLVLNQDMSAFEFTYLHEGHNDTDFRHMLLYHETPEARS